MDRYDSYKASGIEWVGEIPSHWNRLRLKHTVLCSGGSFIDGDWIEAKDISEEGIKYLTSGNVGVITYKEQGSGYITQDTFVKLGCLDVYAGDILISRLNEPISRACIVPELNSRIVTCVDNVIYRPDKSIFDYRFVVYTLNNRYYTEHANLIARGTTMHRISRTTLGGLSIPVPTLAEQQAIADWLDKKCGEIDRVIEKQSKRIELLEELKQTIITNAVTKGLNSDVQMKTSGVEWIGEIPQHWDMVKIKFNFNIYAGATPKTEVLNYWDGDIVWITPADYKTKDKYISCGQRHISKDGYNSCNTQLVPKGSLIFSKRAPIGTVALSDIELCTNQGCLSCVPRRCSSLYYYYVTSVYTEIFDLLGSGATFKEISANDFANIKLPSPAYEEQLAIADYLDAETAKIDAQIAKVNKEIELLQEYKQSIITEVVTGKRKVC